ncbi:MAG: hypothetical protein SVX43_20200 [Cyanobacteriota bacterium]|nr:hypothetical protein [Cyanobacteriota bacterium]
MNLFEIDCLMNWLDTRFARLLPSPSDRVSFQQSTPDEFRPPRKAIAIRTAHPQQCYCIVHLLHDPFNAGRMHPISTSKLFSMT